MSIGINKIIVIVISFIIGIVLGWIACLLFEDYSFLTLERDVSLMDIFAVLIDLFIAAIVVSVVEKGLQNKRVEKDIYIAELNSIINILEPLGDKCAKDKALSYNVTVYDIGRMRKGFIRLWQMIEERESQFLKKTKRKKRTICKSDKDVEYVINRF